MNSELEALLKRIEQAGGPVRIREFDDGERRVQPRGLFGDPDAWGPGPFIGMGYWAGIDDATVIQALKLDAQRRGCAVLATQGAATLRSGAGATNPVDWKVLVWPRDKPSSDYEAAEHESEPAAWALAWLALFEQVPA